MKPYFMLQPLSSEPQGTAHSTQKHDRYARDQHRIHPCAPASSSIGGARAGATLTSAGGRSCCDIQGCDFSAVRPELEPRPDSGGKEVRAAESGDRPCRQAVLEEWSQGRLLAERKIVGITLHQGLQPGRYVRSHGRTQGLRSCR